MNGVHDMGGMHGMGPIVCEPNEPVFHHEWERRAFAITVATGYLGRWNLDMTRFAREQMPPAEYLATSYYEHWLWGLEFLLRQNDLVKPEEIEARMRDPRSAPAAASAAGVRLLKAADVERVSRDPRGARVEADIPPRFKPGDRVRARNVNPIGHTRLPCYARGRQGIVDRDHGVWVFPDTHATGEGKKPQHVYSVRFGASELWGSDASPGDFVYVDLWDDYLDPA